MALMNPYELKKGKKEEKETPEFNSACMKEGKEHPELAHETIIKIVQDHLKGDPKYYEEEKENDKHEKKESKKKELSEHKK